MSNKEKVQSLTWLDLNRATLLPTILVTVEESQLFGTNHYNIRKRNFIGTLSETSEEESAKIMSAKRKPKRKPVFIILLISANCTYKRAWMTEAAI